MNIKTVTGFPVEAEAIIFVLSQDDKMSKLLASIARRYSLDPGVLERDFKAKSGEVLTTYSAKRNDTTRLYLVGLGTSSDFGRIAKVSRSFFLKMINPSKSVIAISLKGLPRKRQPVVAGALTNGLVTAQYDLGLFKTHKTKKDELQVTIISESKDIAEAIDRAQIIGETQVRVMDLVNSPANKLNPSILADWVKASGKKFGYKVKVMEKEEIVNENLAALLAVNRGSDNPPRFIIASYTSKGASKTIGLVGKGVTFDTGGISIKPSSNMHYMKSDMGGAGAVLGAIEAAARLKLHANLVAIVPATENSIGSSATKPGDVIDSYSGKSIEVIDTDAEGRLILADALAYMTRNYDTDLIIDYATLTGSVIRTFGYHAAGLFCNDDTLANDLAKAGDLCGERVWPLPIWTEYEEDLESDVADIKNFSGKPVAGAISAAKFLEAFIDGHPRWAHIDIAGTAFGDSDYGKQKNATAFGVGLTVTLLEQMIA